HQRDDAADGGFRIVRLHEVEVALESRRAEVGHRALVDAMSAGDDAALCGLRNTSVSRTTGTASDEMTSDGGGTVGLEKPYRPRRTDPVAVQENHDFPHRLLLGPGGENAGGANRSDTVDLA